MKYHGVHNIAPRTKTFVEKRNQGKQEKVLATMGMAGQLQIIAKFCIFHCRTRLVRHKNGKSFGGSCPRSACIGQEQSRIFFSTCIGHTGYNKLLTIHFKCFPLVEQNIQPHVPPCVDPGHESRVIFVITHSNEHPQTGTESGQQTHILCQNCGSIIHKISGNQNQIRGKGIAFFHHFFQPQGFVG